MTRHALRGFASPRRRPPVSFSPYGFLRPPRRHEEEQQRFIEQLRDQPQLRREYRVSLLVQIGVVGALCVACLALVVQSAVMVHRMQVPALASLGWFLPACVGLLALLVLRRLLRLVADYRSLSDR